MLLSFFRVSIQLFSEIQVIFIVSLLLQITLQHKNGGFIVCSRKKSIFQTESNDSDTPFVIKLIA